MRPPIPSPDGKIFRNEKMEFDAKERSISHHASVLSSTRLQLKCAFFCPLICIGVVILIVVLALLPIIAPIKILSLWQAYVLVATLVLLTFFFLIPIFLPLRIYLQLCVRGYDETTVINTDGVRNVAKRFSVFVAWHRVMWIIVWSGDIFLVTFGGGVFIPRHAFYTSQESEDFIRAARQFHSKARQKHWDTKANH